jgi:hypothetical protein
MEKRQQQQGRERGRLRKKLRPTPGAVVSTVVPVDDEDKFDVYGHARGRRGAEEDGEDGSERGPSGEDEFSELEEHLAQVAK